MNFSFHSCLTNTICFLLLVSSAVLVSAQTPPSQPLMLNQPIESEIKGGESQFYLVNVSANQTARVEIEQKGVDVSLGFAK